MRFEVQDTGIGINLEDRDKIFQSFFQADSSSTRQYAGTGLGLAICKQLVQLMNCKIGVKSKVGKGATFWFTATFECSSLDMAAKHKDTAELNLCNNQRNLYSKNTQKALETLNILVVEDPRINQKVILQQLKGLGYTADCVNKGQ